MPIEEGYADQRKATYGGIKPEEYVAWFLPISRELLRVLKPSDTFILNIKEKSQDGERHRVYWLAYCGSHRAITPMSTGGNPPIPTKFLHTQ